MIKCIDVSKFQKNIDFNKVKADGIDAVIIRAGYGKTYEDPFFILNIKAAYKAGLKIGVYWFIYAKTMEDIINNTKMCDATLRNFKDNITLGVWCDFEYDSDRYVGRQLSKEERTKWVKYFCDTLKAKGYDTGIYANPDYIKNKFGNISNYPLWLAAYSLSSEEALKYNPVIWQYYDKGKIDGINGYVDLDLVYNTDENTSKPDNAIVVTNGSNLMLRQKPDGKSSIIEKIPNGSRITIINKKNSKWYYAEYNNNKGYVYSKYIKED